MTPGSACIARLGDGAESASFSGTRRNLEMHCSACHFFASGREFPKLKLLRVRCIRCGMTEFRRLDTFRRGVLLERPSHFRPPAGEPA